MTANSDKAMQTRLGPRVPTQKPEPKVVTKVVNKAKPKKKALVLDEDKPFGSVHGAIGYKARYFQDGNYFDGKGNLCDPIG